MLKPHSIIINSINVSTVRVFDIIYMVKVVFIAKTFKMLSSPTVIIPCILVMIMMIYYLKTTNEGKTIALSELKTNLLSERENFKKQIAKEHRTQP